MSKKGIYPKFHKFNLVKSTLWYLICHFYNFFLLCFYIKIFIIPYEQIENKCLEFIRTRVQLHQLPWEENKELQQLNAQPQEVRETFCRRKLQRYKCHWWIPCWRKCSLKATGPQWKRYLESINVNLLWMGA